MKKRIINSKKLSVFLLILLLCSMWYYTYRHMNNNSIQPPSLLSNTYSLVWNDEFDGNELNTENWSYDIGGGNSLWGNHELQYYTDTPENVSVSDGMLKITALKESKDEFSYTSGRIKTAEKQCFQYGYIESRIKLTNNTGFLPAFWMLGTEADWSMKDGSVRPKVAEVDIMEYPCDAPVVYGTIHWTEGENLTLHSNSSCDTEPTEDFWNDFDASDWHTYAVKWTPETISWYVDEQEYKTFPITNDEMNEFHKPFYLLLNLAVGGDWPGNPNEDTEFPNSMYVDYVRVYQDCSKHTTSDIRTDNLRKTVFALVSSAENSSVNYSDQYSYIEDINDGRGYTAGIIGFTSGTGDLLAVVNKYLELKPDNNTLQSYVPALEKVIGNDSHDGLDISFVNAWQAAASDPEMIQAQNAILDSMYLTPAVEYAQTDGLSALGQYIYYDALVVHGPGDDKESFNGIRKAALEAASPPSQGGDEREYLLTFLDKRTTIMQLEEAHSDLSRLETQRKFIDEKNYNLELPLEWTMYGDSYSLTSEILDTLP